MRWLLRHRTQSGPLALLAAATVSAVESGRAGAPSDILDATRMRAAASALGCSSLAVLIPDLGVRSAEPSGDLLYWRGGRLGTYRVPLVDEPDQPESPGCFIPPGVHLPRQRTVVPLQGQLGPVGQLVLPRSGRVRSVERATLLELLAANWGLQLENARLARQSQSSLLDTIESLIAGVEARDPYTSGHSKRVCKYSLLVGESLGLDSPTLEEVAIGAALHDVGKLGVPEHVLTKPGRLDDDDWSLMRLHPKVGARIVDGFNQSRRVLDGIVHHHERFDGSGYPSRLAGEAIPLVARIIGVADALDAMTSGRAYQRNRTMAEALGQLRIHSGRQFDPRVVQAALAVSPATLTAASEQWRS